MPHLQLVVVQLGVAVGDAHEQPREPGEPARAPHLRKIDPTGKQRRRPHSNLCRSVALSLATVDRSTHALERFAD